MIIARSEAFIGCNYFKWCSEDGGHDHIVSIDQLQVYQKLNKT